MAQPDELVDFHHLRARRGLTQLEIEDQVATDLQRATGTADAESADSNRLNRVLQLTGARALCLPPRVVAISSGHPSRSIGNITELHRWSDLWLKVESTWVISVGWFNFYEIELLRIPSIFEARI